MAKPKTELPKNIVDRLVSNLQIGIAEIESGKDGYVARNTDNSNPDLQALGKYQFVPKYWWKDIQSFAKKNGYDNINDHEDFLRSPSLQDSFFRHYVKKDILPQAQKVYESGQNPDNLTLEEMTAFFHFQSPEVAKKAITMGEEEYRKSTKKGKDGATVNNIGMKKYRDKYREALKTREIQQLTKAEVTNPKTKEQIGKYYFTQKGKIIYNSSDLSKEEKNKRIQELNAEYKAKGQIGIVNDYIENRNEKLREEHTPVDPAEKEKLRKMLEFSKEAKLNAGVDKDGNPIIAKSVIIPTNSSESRQHFIDWAEANDVKYNEQSNLEFEVPGFDKILKKQFKKVTGKTLDVKTKGTKASAMQNDVANIAASFGGNKLMPATFDIDNVDQIVDSAGSLTQIQKLDPQYIPDPVKIPESSKTKTSGSESKTKAKTEVDKKNPIVDDGVNGAANQTIDAELSLLSLGTNKTLPVESKRELPIDAITGMALGLIGDEQADNANIPLRTEEVSQAFKKFSSDLAKRSKEGLPAEVEAAMNNKLAEAYQGGLRSIVNASGGNRATVLGNQGQLEVAKNRGLVDIELADFEAKEKAFQQYGEAIKYKNDFDARRDIANHSIKYQEGKRDQRLGQELAEAGFSQLVEGIKYQRENGPGSANSLYEAHLYQKMFGFNPNAPDDGTGKPGTRSAFEMKRKEVEEKQSTAKTYQAKLNAMNPNQRKAANEFFETNTDRRNQYEFLDYLEKNPNVNPDKINMENMDLAVNKKDYGLLSIDRKEIDRQETISKPVIDKKEVSNFFANPQTPVNASNQPEGLLATAQKPNSPEEVNDNEENETNFAKDYESGVLANLPKLA